jgi:hypothetical protein
LSHHRLASGDSLERVDRFQWPLALALGLLLFDPMFQRRRRSEAL